jgi:ABC-type Zn2+ transport system substrate-binding protein/surface adhesin
MKGNFSIQLKAAFLLIVFSLNTVIGFACAMGLDMGFNHKHHHDSDNTTIQKNSHHHGRSHDHDEADNDHHKSKNDKDNCCNDGIMKFAQVDKSLPQASKFAVNPLFFTAFVSSYYNIDVLLTSHPAKRIKYFVRSYHPPITDICIAIQSFRI